jgi:hypothetical protein
VSDQPDEQAPEQGEALADEEAPEETASEEAPPEQVKLRPHDPFSPYVTPVFREDRWRRAGATDAEVKELRAEWEALGGPERLVEQQRIDGIADPDLAAQLRERREGGPARPGAKAKVGVWRAYAKRLAPERAEQVDDMSKHDLMAEFGGE